MEPTEYTHPDFLEIYDREPTFHQTYQPHIWAVRKDDIYNAIDAIKIGLSWVEDSLQEVKILDHCFAKTQLMSLLENDIRRMESAKKALMGYDGSSEI